MFYATNQTRICNSGIRFFFSPSILFYPHISDTVEVDEEWGWGDDDNNGMDSDEMELAPSSSNDSSMHK
jgi:hypothetical protein